MNTSTAKGFDGAADVRLQIDVPADFAPFIDQIQEICGFKTRRETIVAALAHLGWTAGETLAGRRVGSLDGDGTIFKEVVPLVGLRVHFAYGSIVRREEGGFRVIIKPSFPLASIAKFAELIDATQFVMICADDELSQNPHEPNVLTSEKETSLPEGAEIPGAEYLGSVSHTTRAISLKA